MPSVYTGDEANVVPFLTATVASWNSSSPVRLTTTAAHGFTTGDWIYTASVGMPSIAAQYFKINVISSTVIELIGSTNDSTPSASGAGILDFSLSPAAQIPSDGDVLNASSILASLETLADRTQYLSGAKGFNYTPGGSPPLTTTLGIPSLKPLVGPLERLLDNDVHNANAITANTATIATHSTNIAAIQAYKPGYYLADYAVLGGVSGLAVALSDPTVLLETPFLLASTLPAVVGDRAEIEVNLEFELCCASGATACVVKLQASQNGGSYVDVPGASVKLETSIINTVWSGLALKGVVAVATAGTLGFRLNCNLSVHGAYDFFNANTNFTANYKLLRAAA